MIYGSLTIDKNETNRSKNLIFNFDRNASSPQEPSDINITAINLYVKSVYTVEGTDFNRTIEGNSTDSNTTIDSNTTFYYGRVHAPDYRFAGNKGNATIFYEVYCDSCDKTDFNITGAESADSINWYVKLFIKLVMVMCQSIALLVV